MDAVRAGGGVLDEDVDFDFAVDGALVGTPDGAEGDLTVGGLVSGGTEVAD